jgi:hypothetical protein
VLYLGQVLDVQAARLAGLDGDALGQVQLDRYIHRFMVVEIDLEGDAVLARFDKRPVVGTGLINNDYSQQMTKYMLRYAFEAARTKAANDNPGIAKDIKNFQFWDLLAKAGTDTEDISGIAAAQASWGTPRRP